MSNVALNIYWSSLDPFTVLVLWVVRFTRLDEPKLVSEPRRELATELNWPAVLLRLVSLARALQLLVLPVEHRPK
ncbi:hypothetical protein BpHYR1_006604 [Brachionus plicatilis]|uniref:Uncharacterized protein n=1 Tax=Brachionus plicatilis TaxID=10195 RepID=A0A3M7QPS3_BRAPC|nr:hypothetical protein BpHYR1_006604 [Brachionus plicatilis]